jgi:hypothetical protein
MEAPAPDFCLGCDEHIGKLLLECQKTTDESKLQPVGNAPTRFAEAQMALHHYQRRGGRVNQIFTQLRARTSWSYGVANATSVKLQRKLLLG